MMTEATIADAKTSVATGIATSIASVADWAATRTSADAPSLAIESDGRVAVQMRCKLDHAPIDGEPMAMVLDGAVPKLTNDPKIVAALKRPIGVARVSRTTLGGDRGYGWMELI